MRKKINYLLSFASIALLTGCSLLTNSDYEKISQSNTIKYEFNESTKNTINDKLVKCEELLNSDNYDEFYSLYNEITSQDLLNIATYRNMANINFDITGSSTLNDKYTELNSYLSELIEWEEDFYKKIYNSKFKEQFFKDYDEEEINELINSKSTDKSKKLEGEIEELLSNYRLIEDINDNKVDQIYLSLIDKYNQLAKEYKYDNYIDYAYAEIYGRDYQDEEINIFTNNVGKYIAPEFLENYPLFKSSVNNLGNSDRNQISNFMNSSYKSYTSYFTAYAKSIDGSYYLQANDILQSNKIYYGSSSKSTNGAYTTYLYSLRTPVIYLGSDYQGIMTFVHEFGHFYNYSQNFTQNSSMDLAETQSQGNEMLFTAFLSNNKYFNSPAMDVLVKNNLLEAYSTIIISSIVSDFEEYVYTHELNSMTSFDDIFKNCCEKYGGYDKLKETLGTDFYDYWRKVCIENALYYISYAVSLIPSISFYQLGVTNYTNAVNSYLGIQNFDYDQYSFVDIINKNNLYSPFEEDSFIQIIEII